ncbi:MAG TPA: hypothetical protein VE890_14385, partial [Thermoguttaceae bacterium]|nr:hypothetical protein [Thermoguttaceae bacterium]
MSQRRSFKRTLLTAAIALTPLLTIATWGRAETTASDECLQRIEISSGWKIKFVAPCEELDASLLGEAKRKDEGWLDAGLMPATVHDILLRLGKIESPWLPRGTEKCYWVGRQDWVYAVPFSVRDQGRQTRIRFQGIENKVDVYLNGQRLASHASKLPLIVDVSGRLRRENELVLHCHADLPD